MSFIPTFKGLRTEYGLAYLPAFSYVYLYVATSPRVFEIWRIQIWSHDFYQVAALLCIVGGIILHKMFQLIFGSEGPSQNPKDRKMVLKYIASFSWGLDITQVDLKDDSSARWYIQLSKIASEKSKFKHFLRLLIIGVPITGVWILKYVSVPLLYVALTTQPTQPIIGGALLSVQIIVILQSYIWNWFPSYVPPEAQLHLHTPEYKRIAENKTNSRQSNLDEYS